jgi:hypothetical protein
MPPKCGVMVFGSLLFLCPKPAQFDDLYGYLFRQGVRSHRGCAGAPRQCPVPVRRVTVHGSFNSWPEFVSHIYYVIRSHILCNSISPYYHNWATRIFRPGCLDIGWSRQAPRQREKRRPRRKRSHAQTTMAKVLTSPTVGHSRSSSTKPFDAATVDSLPFSCFPDFRDSRKRST